MRASLARPVPRYCFRALEETQTTAIGWPVTGRSGSWPPQLLLGYGRSWRGAWNTIESPCSAESSSKLDVLRGAPSAEAHLRKRLHAEPPLVQGHKGDKSMSRDRNLWYPDVFALTASSDLTQNSHFKTTASSRRPGSGCTSHRKSFCGALRGQRPGRCAWLLPPAFARSVSLRLCPCKCSRARRSGRSWAWMQLDAEVTGSLEHSGPKPGP